MTTASDLAKAERRLEKIEDLLTTLQISVLADRGVRIDLGGYMFDLNEHAAPEVIEVVRNNLWREALNLKALLRKHKLIE